MCTCVCVCFARVRLWRTGRSRTWGRLDQDGPALPSCPWFPAPSHALRRPTGCGAPCAPTHLVLLRPRLHHPLQRAQLPALLLLLLLLLHQPPPAARLQLPPHICLAHPLVHLSCRGVLDLGVWWWWGGGRILEAGGRKRAGAQHRQARADCMGACAGTEGGTEPHALTSLHSSHHPRSDPTTRSPPSIPYITRDLISV